MCAVPVDQRSQKAVVLYCVKLSQQKVPVSEVLLGLVRDLRLSLSYKDLHCVEPGGPQPWFVGGARANHSS